MNNTGTKKLIVASGTPSPNLAPERVILVNETNQSISTKTDAELDSKYAPLAVDQFVDPFPSWFGGGTVNESIADIVNNMVTAPTNLFVPATLFGNIGSTPTLSFVVTPANALFRVPVWRFTDTEDDIIGATIAVPSGWSTANVYLWWTNYGAGSGDVSWGGAHLLFGDGDTTNAGTVSAPSANYTAPAQYVTKRSKLNVSPITVSGDPLLHYGLVRNGSLAGDTLANDAAVIGLELVRVS